MENFTPNRITPMPDDEFNALNELEALGMTTPDEAISDVLLELLDHAQTPQMQSTLLDWAAQLRKEQSLSWVDALEAAGIALFG